MKIKIHWNEFIEIAKTNLPKESCAMLFTRFPYTKREEWFVVPIKNSSENPIEEWDFDKTELTRAKLLAKRNQMVRIGNVHVHPFINEKNFISACMPSELDLKYAKKYNDLVRGIIHLSKKEVLEIYFHDMYGNKIEVEE
jgi:proteasome lid subunit RPN8/RPN11